MTTKGTEPTDRGRAGRTKGEELLAMSQVGFATFLGAGPSTVRSWEQGLRPPNPLACRLLSEIEADPAHWRKRLAACLVGPETSGLDTKAEARSRPARRTQPTGTAR